MDWEVLQSCVAKVLGMLTSDMGLALLLPKVARWKSPSPVLLCWLDTVVPHGACEGLTRDTSSTNH